MHACIATSSRPPPFRESIPMLARSSYVGCHANAASPADRASLLLSMTQTGNSRERRRMKSRAVTIFCSSQRFMEVREGGDGGEGGGWETFGPMTPRYEGPCNRCGRISGSLELARCIPGRCGTDVVEGRRPPTPSSLLAAASPRLVCGRSRPPGRPSPGQRGYASRASAVGPSLLQIHHNPTPSPCYRRRDETSREIPLGSRGPATATPCFSVCLAVASRRQLFTPRVSLAHLSRPPVDSDHLLVNFSFLHMQHRFGCARGMCAHEACQSRMPCRAPP